MDLDLGCESYPAEHCPDTVLPPVKALYRLSLAAPPAVTVDEGSVSTDVFVNLRVPDDAVAVSGWGVRVQTNGGPGCPGRRSSN